MEDWRRSWGTDAVPAPLENCDGYGDEGPADGRRRGPPIGFSSRAVSPKELMPAAMAVAEDCVGPPPLAVQTKKRVAIVSRGIPMANSRLVADVYGGADRGHEP